VRWPVAALVVTCICAGPLTSLPAKAAAPKRLLLVTTTVGFRHAAVPLQEQVFRALATSTGEFTVVSTTDSPDYPAAEYRATVDQRDARIRPSASGPNPVPAKVAQVLQRRRAEELRRCGVPQHDRRASDS
jgi:hypothetical protein